MGRLGVLDRETAVLPKGKARIRVQLSAAHSEDDVRTCVQAFIDARSEVLGS